jgi:hypothetical protein
MIRRILNPAQGLESGRDGEVRVMTYMRVRMHCGAEVTESSTNKQHQYDPQHCSKTGM